MESHLASIHDGLGLLANRGAGGHGGAQHVAGCQMAQAVLFDNVHGLKRKRKKGSRDHNIKGMRRLYGRCGFADEKGARGGPEDKGAGCIDSDFRYENGETASLFIPQSAAAAAAVAVSQCQVEWKAGAQSVCARERIE